MPAVFTAGAVDCLDAFEACVFKHPRLPVFMRIGNNMHGDTL